MSFRRTRIPALSGQGVSGPIDDKVIAAPVSVLAFTNYVGDGNTNRSISIGPFLPTWAFVTNQSGTARDAHMKTSAMAAGSSYGFTAELLETDRIDILETGGIRVDADVDVNETSTVYDAIAVKDSSSGIKVLQYTGDGNDDRDLTGVGFDPELVIVARTNLSSAGMMKIPNSPALTSYTMKNGVSSTSRIKTLITDGFRVGTSSKVNGSGDTYQAICWRSFDTEEGKVKILQYTGDSNDDRALTGVGFQPKFIYIGSDEQHMHKSEGMGTSSKRHTTPTLDTNMIKSFDSDGFTLGTHLTVNLTGISYSALCLSD